LRWERFPRITPIFNDVLALDSLPPVEETRFEQEDANCFAISVVFAKGGESPEEMGFKERPPDTSVLVSSINCLKFPASGVQGKALHANEAL
jgi:hypothetical protein